MRKESLAEVRDTLWEYANRGIFHGFSETDDGEFSFVWFHRHQMQLIVDSTSDELCFRRLLPGVASSSALYKDLKRYLIGRQNESLPEHRRVDRGRAELKCSNRGGLVSVSLKVKNNDYGYGVKKIVNLVHELFVYLREIHPEYLMENFDVPQD